MTQPKVDVLDLESLIGQMGYRGYDKYVLASGPIPSASICWMNTQEETFSYSPLDELLGLTNGSGDGYSVPLCKRCLLPSYCNSLVADRGTVSGS